jgi:hypothetical protein
VVEQHDIDGFGAGGGRVSEDSLTSSESTSEVERGR